MAKKYKHQHLKHQKKKQAAGGKDLFILFRELNKYTGIDALLTFKLGLCF